MTEIIRPLVVPDIETTGLNKQTDHIIQFAAIKVDRQTGNIIDSINLYIKPSGPYTITIQAYLKHRIKPEFLEDKPTFVEVADQIRDFFEGCDILTYNGNSFDLPFIKSEYQRIGQDIDFLHFNKYDAFLEEKKRNSNMLEPTFERYVVFCMNSSFITRLPNAFTRRFGCLSTFFTEAPASSPPPTSHADSILTGR